MLSADVSNRVPPRSRPWSTAKVSLPVSMPCARGEKAMKAMEWARRKGKRVLS